jgi:hypothetical protein
MALTVDALVATFRLNFALKQYPPTVLDAFNLPISVVDSFNEKADEINADPYLMPAGQFAQLTALGTAVLEKLNAWIVAQRTNLGAQITALETALVPPPATLDPKTVELMAAELRNYNPTQLEVLYGSADDNIEKPIMEAASKLLGRVPVKAANGSLSWAWLLDPKLVEQSVMDRANASNPQGAQKLAELREILGMSENVFTVAAGEISNVTHQRV